MKIFCALAVIAIVVSAYKYTVPKFPCAFQMWTSIKENGGEPEEHSKRTVNDHFLRVKGFPKGVEMHTLYRVDITKEVNGTQMIGTAILRNGTCQTDWVSMDSFLELFNGLYDEWFGNLNKATWKNKDDGVEYYNKNCTVYYNDDLNKMALYVYEDYPFVIRTGGNESIIEWEWEIPLDRFKLEECGGDFAKTPDAKYSHCDSSSSHSDSHSDSHSNSYVSSHQSSNTSVASSIQAVVVVVFGVIAASLIALF